MNQVEKEHLYIQMFGHFQISGMGGILEEENIRSEMLTKLLAYFFCHHNQNVSVQELQDALWPDGGSDNPAGALKNLMYRLRTLLKNQWPSWEFIQTGKSAYSWSDDITLTIDSEEFENYCKEAEREKDLKKKATAYEKAVVLYRGSFLPRLTGEYWIASLSTYYHSMYIKVVKELAALWEGASRYKETEQLCSRALQLDPLDEDIHCFFIRSLVRQNQIKLAMEQYQKAVNILYENLGINPSAELRLVYEELLKQTNKQEMDILTIQKELHDKAINAGAFLCEYGVFKETYQLEARRAERFGMSVYFSLITVIPIIKVKEGSKAYLELVNKATEGLQEVLVLSLRAGDVVSKYSGTQFVVLLPTCQQETAKKVIERIEKAFYGRDRKSKVRLQYSLEEISSI